MSDSCIKYFDIQHDEFRINSSNKNLVIGNGDHSSYLNFTEEFSFFLCFPTTDEERNNLMINHLTCDKNITFCVVDLSKRKQIDNFIATFPNYFDFIYCDSNCPYSFSVNDAGRLLSPGGMYETTNRGFKLPILDAFLKKIDKDFATIVGNEDYIGTGYNREITKYYFTQYFKDRFFLYPPKKDQRDFEEIYQKAHSVCEKLILMIISLSKVSNSKIEINDDITEMFERFGLFDLRNPLYQFNCLMNMYIFLLWPFYDQDITDMRGKIFLEKGEYEAIIVRKFFVKPNRV